MYKAMAKTSALVKRSLSSPPWHRPFLSRSSTLQYLRPCAADCLEYCFIRRDAGSRVPKALAKAFSSCSLALPAGSSPVLTIHHSIFALVLSE